MDRLKVVFTISCLSMVLWMQCSTPKEKTVPEDEYEIADPQNEKEGEVHTVEIKQMKFYPDEINAHKGDKIVWINKDIVEHDVTEFAKKRWASSKLATGASWSMVITQSEIYYCNLHVVMRGKIIVDGELPPDVVESSMIPICR